MQTLNVQQQNIKQTKIQFILEEINKQFPEIIYLIDTAREFKIGGNYDTYFDGRNELIVRSDCILSVVVGNNQNWMEIPEIEMGFIYITPNTYDKPTIIGKIEEWNIRKWSFCGDFNLKSNSELTDIIRWKGGEITKQTGIVGPINNLKLLNAPSDHRLLAFTITRKIKYSSILKLTRIIDKGFELTGGFIEDLLEGKLSLESIPKTKYQISTIRAIENDEELTIMRIVNNFKRGQVTGLYDKFGWMWRCNRKEPFIGTRIPSIVMDSFKKELKHDPQKEKKKFDDKLPMIFEDEEINGWIKYDKKGFIKSVNVPLPSSKSKAMTMEMFQLKEIGRRIKAKIEQWIFEGKRQGVKELQSNIQKAFNMLMENGCFYNNTFFLRKKYPMKSYRDVRMITVMPVLIKVWEALTYDKVNYSINKVLYNEEQYQLGALKGSSTYEALAILRAKVIRFNAAGVLSIDLTKGYEKVNHEILKDAINSLIKEENTKMFLLFWLNMVNNMDYMVNGQLIKATIGIPMGLSFSPLAFILYIHWGLNDLDKEFLVGFMDDFNVVILQQGMNDNFIKSFFEAMDKIGMVINESKSTIFTFNEVIDDQRRDYIFRGIRESNSLKFLGRELTWLENGISGEYCTYVQAFDIPKVFPKWLTLAMRRLILIGGICSKHRYITFMWAFMRKDFKQKYIMAIFNFMRINFEKPMYLQLIMIYPNLYRELIDYTNWNNIGTLYKNLLYDTFGQGWKSITDLEKEMDSKGFSMEKKKAFREKRIPIMNNLLSYLETGIPQIDVKLNNIWDYNFYNKILLIAAKYNGNWADVRDGLNEAWGTFKTYKIKEWYIEQKVLNYKWWVMDLTKEPFGTNWAYFASYKYFGIVMDMIFGRLKYEGDRQWDHWIFDILKLGKDYINGKISWDKLYGKRDMPKFLVIDIQSSASERFRLTEDLIYTIAEKEKYFFANPWDRKSKDKKKKSKWKQAKSYIGRFRRFFFVLDSIYARQDLRDKSYSEIDLAFQMKMYASSVSGNDLNKILIVQDWEEINYNNLNEEDYYFENYEESEDEEDTI